MRERTAWALLHILTPSFWFDQKWDLMTHQNFTAWRRLRRYGGASSFTVSTEDARVRLIAAPRRLTLMVWGTRPVRRMVALQVTSKQSRTASEAARTHRRHSNVNGLWPAMLRAQQAAMVSYAPTRYVVTVLH